MRSVHPLWYWPRVAPGVSIPRAQPRNRAAGDGMSLAYRAGLGLRDMEMVQYHPLGFCERAAFASEGALGEGRCAVQLGRTAHPSDREPAASGRAVSLARFRRGRAYDTRFPLDWQRAYWRPDSSIWSERPMIWLASVWTARRCLSCRACIGSWGGIQTDTNGATAVSGLFAAGECASPGVHGANALTGNALTASVVFGRRAGSAAAAPCVEHPLHRRLPTAALPDTRRTLEAIFSRPTSGGYGGHDSACAGEHNGRARWAGTGTKPGCGRPTRCVTDLQTRYTQVGLRHHGKKCTTMNCSAFL